jgi:hypothetical protein
MCAFNIPWICCKGCEFISMCIIYWIKCVGGWMTCYHRIFNYQKKENKEGEENKMIQFMVNTPIFANWVKIEITKIFQKKPCK